MTIPFKKRLAAASVLLLLAGCAGPGGEASSDLPNTAEAADSGFGAARGPIVYRSFDGVTDDLLTAGLGAAGLADVNPPTPRDKLNPTAAELRRRTIYANYRALVDTSAAGGYGTLYGPTVGLDGRPVAGTGMIAGEEWLTLVDGPGVGERISLLVQVPAGFDTGHPCIVTAPSSGSRGIYGAIGTSGEWGLKRGCAVAYADKGTGTGAVDLVRDATYAMTGERIPATPPRPDATFDLKTPAPALARFNAQNPDRWAFKHAHSRTNPESRWDDDVLRSIVFAFDVLNGKFGEAGRPRPFTSQNTMVIGSSVSNGGGASVRAAEQDFLGLIDGIAVSEPNVQPIGDEDFTIVQGNRPPVTRHGRPLFDYVTLLNVYQPCASLAPAHLSAPLNTAASEARCASLARHGLLKSTTTDTRAVEAQRIINDYGFLEEQNYLQPSHWTLYVHQAIAVTYANAYARAGVTDQVCGYGFAAIGPNGMPAPPDPEVAAILFAISNGIPPVGPPVGGVQLINERAPGGPKEDRASTPDQNLNGALCLRSLWLGRDAVTGRPLRGEQRRLHRMIRAGIDQVRATGNLGNRPVVIANGRADAVLPPNHTSRSYYGMIRSEGDADNIHYYEITNAHHLDTLNGVPGINERAVPLHYYFIQSLNLLYDHLRNGTPLPPSQVVHTVPRGAGAPPITPANVPPIQAAPTAATRIGFTGNSLTIPE
jgi:hydroxybutyrate-dimer hydrolase